jgi:LysM repeat protein
MDTNAFPSMDTNALPPMDTNAFTPTPMPAPAPTPYVPEIPAPAPAPAMSEYVVQSGDSFYTIAKNHGTTITAMQAANPGVDSRRLKIGQKLVLPAPNATSTTGAFAPAPAVSSSSETLYTVKSGDNLLRIASRFGTTVKAIKSLNGLSTDQIKVGQKLKIPAKPAPAPEPVPVAPTFPEATTTPAPVR